MESEELDNGGAAEISVDRVKNVVDELETRLRRWLIGNSVTSSIWTSLFVVSVGLHVACGVKNSFGVLCISLLALLVVRYSIATATLAYVFYCVRRRRRRSDGDDDVTATPGTGSSSAERATLDMGRELGTFRRLGVRVDRMVDRGRRRVSDRAADDDLLRHLTEAFGSLRDACALRASSSKRKRRRRRRRRLPRWFSASVVCCDAVSLCSVVIFVAIGADGGGANGATESCRAACAFNWTMAAFFLLHNVVCLLATFSEFLAVDSSSEIQSPSASTDTLQVDEDENPP